MSTESEDILSRYKDRFTVKDDRGRQITLRRLRLSDQSKVLEFTDKPLNRFNFNVVSSVVSIDDVVVFFPKSLEDIHITMDILDQEGFSAVSTKYIEINGMAEKKVPPAGTASDA